MSASLMFIGLCEKAGKLVFGEDNCGMAARAKKAKVILTASDSARNSQVRAKSYAEYSKAPWVAVPWSKDELGRIIGRGQTGMAAITDVGMASAFMDKLCSEYPDRFEAERGILHSAALKAQQRKTEKQKHIENVRHGKKK